MKKAIPTGLFGRARRICNDEDTFNQQASNIRGRLTQRGYPSHVIDRGYDIARKKDKSQLMKRKTAKKTDSRVPMVITFSKFLPDIKQILQKNRKILNRSERLKKLFPQDPMMAFKRGSNIKDKLVHTKTKRLMKDGDENGGTCGKNCCVCRIMQSGKCIRGMTVGRRNIGCRSHNVVYGVFCDRCDTLCYVGETSTCLYTRVQNHLSSVRCGKGDLPVARHFTHEGHNIDDLKILGLEQVWKDDVFYRRQREARWIKLMGTDKADGLNKRREGFTF